MSDHEAVTTDGVTVEKAFETDEFPVPTVTFGLESAREESVTVRVVDRIPDVVEMDQVGFHPDYDSDDWTAYPDNRVEFECELDPGESVRTVYGVQLQDVGPGAFDTDPEVAAEPVGELGESDATDPVEGSTMSDIASRDGTDVVRDVIGGERDTVPGLDEDEEDEESIAVDAGSADDESEVLDGLGDETDGEVDESAVAPDEETDSSDGPIDLGGEETDDEGDAADDGTVDDVAAVSDDPGGVAASLATAIREDAVDEADLETIAGALGRTRSSAVEVDSLHRRVGELEAYTDALAAFLDENGTATELLERVEGDLDALDERVAALSGEVDAAAEDRAAIREEVANLEALDELEADLKTLRGDLDALDERVAATEDDVDDLDDLDDDVADIEDDIEELREWRDQLSDVFGA